MQVRPNRIHEIAFNSPFRLGSYTITFLPANHCPGAALILFEHPARASVLHCGDCRYSRTIFQAYAQLRVLQNRVILHLDTTYCSPEHSFPPQDEVVREVVRLCSTSQQASLAAGKQPPLFVFGSYTIGKERLFLEVRLREVARSIARNTRPRVIVSLGRSTCRHPGLLLVH
jgi:DNA cross-link repair 1A protein